MITLKKTAFIEYHRKSPPKKEKRVVSVPMSIITSTTMVTIVEDCKTNSKMLTARRLNRKIKGVIYTEYVLIEIVVLTFAGKKIPDQMKLYYCSLKVYIYLNTNCQRYGHLQI